MSIRALEWIDAYKLDHRRQYPPGTTRVYSNFTPRASRLTGVDEVVFFGLQAFLQSYCEEAMKPFFAADEDQVAKDYEARAISVVGPNDIGSEHVRELHRLGYLPLRFRALREGSLVPLRVPMLVVENTHPDFFWLVNYIETILSASLWLPCTSATQAYRMRTLLDERAAQTGGNKDFVDWQGHDFSFRGMASLDAAMISGAGHLLSFTGTDTIPALRWIEQYYAPGDEFLGGSVAATEHSVMCAGSHASELETFRRLIELYPSGIVSVVSDTWDLWHVCTSIVSTLKPEIMARDGKLVIRPDSGDPADIICGDPKAESGSPAHKGVCELLWEVFGGTTNEKGFRVLDSHIGMIYGDSITYERADAITRRLADKRFASTNIVLGLGSFTYQYVTRDTFGFAMKATWAEIDGLGRDLYKAPVTDDGVKRSARGRLAVRRDASGKLALIESATPEQEAASELELVWEDGKRIRTERFGDIRRWLRGQSKSYKVCFEV